eukprot:XP_028345993.1 uncharacterized protein LOC112062922 [Physeter catodon]
MPLHCHDDHRVSCQEYHVLKQKYYHARRNLLVKRHQRQQDYGNSTANPAPSLDDSLAEGTQKPRRAAVTATERSAKTSGNINTIKALKRYWNTPVSDIDDNSSEAKYTVLQMALLLNKRKIVEYMIPQKDLDLTTRATDGTTALMLAVEKEVPLDWVRAMLERGAAENIDAEDHDGRSALDRCKKGSEMYELLLRYGATPRPPTPPPEPPAEPEKPQEDSTVDGNTSSKTGATEVESALNKPFALDNPPGIEEHPGFWASMCGCGGRQGKHTIETVELPPEPKAAFVLPKAKAGPKALPKAKASPGGKAKAKMKAPPPAKAKSPPAAKAIPEEPSHPNAATKAPSLGHLQAAAA